MIPFLSLLDREISRFLKVLVQTVVAPLINSSLYLLLFGVSLGSKVGDHNGVRYLAFLIPGLMMMGLINNAFQNSSSSIVIAKYTGELEDLRVVPLNHHQIIWAMSLAAVVRGEIVALVTYLSGAVFYQVIYQEPLGLYSVWEFLFFSIVGGLTFGMIGLSTAFWAKSFDRLSAINSFVLLPLTYLGGVFISLETLPPFWQKVASLNPLIYFIDGLRHSLIGVSDVSLIEALSVSTVSLLMFYGIALLSLKKASFHRW